MGDMLFETNMFIDVMDIDYLPFAFTLIFVIETGWHFCEVVGPLETHIMAWAHNYVSRKLRKKLVSTETCERQQVPRSMFLFQCHAVPLRQLPQHLIFGTHQREAIADGIQPWELLRWPWHNKNTAWILSKGWTLQIESSLTSLQFNDLIQNVPFFQPPISIVATWAAGSYRVAVSLGHIQRQDKTAATPVLVQH